MEEGGGTVGWAGKGGDGEGKGRDRNRIRLKVGVNTFSRRITEPSCCGPHLEIHNMCVQ